MSCDNHGYISKEAFRVLTISSGDIGQCYPLKHTPANAVCDLTCLKYKHHVMLPDEIVATLIIPYLERSKNGPLVYEYQITYNSVLSLGRYIR